MNRNELTNKRMTSSAGPSSADESPQPPAKRRMLNKQRHELAVPTTPTHAHSLPEESSDSTQDVSINSSSQTTTISPAAQMLAVPSSTALTSPRPQAVTFSSSHAFQKPQSLQQTHHSPLVAVRIDSQSSVPSHRPPAIPQPALPPHPQCRAVLDGYKVLRNAVRPELVSTLNAIVENGLPIQGRGDSYAMFVPPVQGYMIRDEFMNVASGTLNDFYLPFNLPVPKMPTNITIGQFTGASETKCMIPRTGRSDNIRVTIALNPCNPDTGMYLLLRGSHHEKHPSLIPVKEWDNSIISLDAGDALIWRGDLFYFLSPRIGGRWLTLTFGWGPSTSGIVDLTKG